MNPKIKKSLIIASSGIILFAGVFFMTRTISNIVEVSNNKIVSKKDSTNENKSNKVTKNDSDEKHVEEEKNTQTGAETNVSDSNEYTEYVVTTGDTISDIVDKFMPWCSKNEAIKSIIELNNLKSSEIIPVGTHLMIPKNNIDTSNCIEHKVSKGETLYKIATKYFPSADTNKVIELIMKKNNLSSPTLVTEDRVIYIPKNI